MSEKLYKTRRQWHNVRVVALIAPFVLTAASGVGLASGHIKLIVGSFVLVVLAFVVAIIRDRQRPAQYRITDRAMELNRGQYHDTIGAGDILDASTMERVACREYVSRKVQKRLREHGTNARKSESEFMRYCTIDIGLRSYTLGIGRLFIDRMESSRHDLILLRTKSGAEYLLSPERNQDMMEQISRLKRRNEGAAA